MATDPTLTNLPLGGDALSPTKLGLHERSRTNLRNDNRVTSLAIRPQLRGTGRHSFPMLFSCLEVCIFAPLRASIVPAPGPSHTT